MTRYRRLVKLHGKISDALEAEIAKLKKNTHKNKCPYCGKQPWTKKQYNSMLLSVWGQCGIRCSKCKEKLTVCEVDFVSHIQPIKGEIKCQTNQK